MLTAFQLIVVITCSGSFSQTSQLSNNIDNTVICNKIFIEKSITIPSVGIGVVKNRGLVDVNDYIINLTGYSREDLLGKSMRIFYPSDEEYYLMRQDIQRQIENNRTVIFNTRRQHKNGDIIYVMLASVAAGPFIYPRVVIFTVLDITGQRLVPRTLEKRSRLFLVGLIVFIIILAMLIFILILALHNRKKPENEFQTKSRELEHFSTIALDLLCITDANGNFIRVNSEWERILGYSVIELQKRKFLDFVHPDDMKATFDAMASLSAQKEALNFVNRYRCKDGSYRFLEWRSSLHGKLIYAAARDITKSKEEKESLLKTQFAMDRARDSILWLGDDGSLVYANDSACKSMGYKREELLKMKIFDIDPDFPAEKWEQHKKDLRRLGSMSFESRHCTKDGHLFPVDVSINFFSYDDKYLACAFDRDISDRKRVEEELRRTEQQYRALIENSQSVIYTIKADGTITFVSPSVKKMIGYEPDEILHKNQDAVIFKDDIPMYINFLKQTADSGMMQQGVEYRILHKDGSLRWLKSVLTPVYDEKKNLTHIVGNAIDITTRKMAEEELLKAKTKAEESDRLKSVFLANVSHEIRTPMNAILGFLELLKQPNLENDKKVLFIDIVNQSGQHLLTTINDIIEISKIEAGQSEVLNSETSIAETLHYHYTLFKEQADAKGLSLKLSFTVKDDDIIIQTDQQKLEGILTNLLGNAIKFTHQGTIEFGCSVENSKLLIFVKDSGIGIEPDKINAIFDRFVQADLSNKRQFQGSGLGLSIVKAYTELLHGEMKVESELGKGTTFFVSIPVVIAKKKPSEVISAGGITGSVRDKIKLLIAEDDDFSYRYLEMILSGNQIEILHTTNGEDTLKYVKEDTGISIILMDIKMPGMNGLETIQQIRKFNNTIPVIAQTAYAFAGDREKFLKAGFNDYISKPINRQVLMELIKKYAS